MLGACGQVDRVFIQRLALFFGIGVSHGLSSTQFINSLGEAPGIGALFFQQTPNFAAILDGREQEQFARDEGVLALLREFVGEVQQLQQRVGWVHVTTDTADFGQSLQAARNGRADAAKVYTGVLQQLRRHTAVLIEQGREQVGWFYELIIGTEREALGIGQCLLELGGQFVGTHAAFPRIVGRMTGKWGCARLIQALSCNHTMAAMRPVSPSRR